jgi:hypothetical protein
MVSVQMMNQNASIKLQQQQNVLQQPQSSAQMDHVLQPNSFVQIKWDALAFSSDVLVETVLT